MRRSAHLIVDDSALQEQIAVRSRELGVEILPTNLDEEPRLEAPEPDFALIGLEQTGLDGLDYVRMHRTHWPKVPIIVIAHAPSPVVLLAALRATVFDVFDSALGLEALDPVVRRAIAHAQVTDGGALERASDAILNTPDPSRIPESVIAAAIDVMAADAASLFLYQPEDQTLRIAHAVGLPESVWRKTRVKLGEGVAGKVAAARKPMVINGSVSAIRAFKGVEARSEVRSSILYPLFSGRGLVGMLTFNRYDECWPYLPGDLDTASVLASEAMLALEVWRLSRMNAQSEKLAAVGQLAAGIAHEMNTPLQFVGDNVAFLSRAFTALVDAAGALERTVIAAKEVSALAELMPDMERRLKKARLGFLREEVPKALSQSQEGLARVASIVAAMKDFAHPSAGEMTDVNLNDAVRTTVTMSRGAWKEVATVELELDPNLPPVRCVRDEICQVILNLIVNAAHAIGAARGPDGPDANASSAKGKIIITSSVVDGNAVLAIADSGTGIPEAVRPRIFEPFFTTKPVGRGTGQGLSMAHTVVVEKHHGTITFDSQVGAGTTFYVHLPLQQAAPVSRQDPPTG